MIARYRQRAVPFLVLLVLILALGAFFVLNRNSDVPDVPLLTEATTDQGDWLRRIDDRHSQGQVIQALYQIEAWAAQTGWTPELAREAGDIWRDMGDLNRAVSYWELAAAQVDDPILVRQIANADLSLQHWPEATAALKRLVELTPNDGWPRYELGLILAPIDPQAATEYLQFIMDSNTYAEVAWKLIAELGGDASPMRIGLILADYELWPYAELAFTQAAATGESLAEAWAYTGLVRDRQGKDGSSWIQQAVALAPENPQVVYLQGVHWQVVGDYGPSAEALIRAIELDPTNPAFQAELGLTFRLLGELGEAEFWLQSAVQTSEGAPEFQELLALFYAEEAPSLTEAGIAALEETINQLPDNLDAQAGFGWALYKAGQTEAGLAAIDGVLSHTPDLPRALWYKARILLETGQVAEAVPLLQQVAQSEVEFAVEAQRILQNLNQE